MCGIIGIVGNEAVNHRLYDGLTLLQHRGQDAAGIATSHNGKLMLRKGAGLVRDVFNAEHMQRLQGDMGIGHVRYPTAGTSASAEAQPFYVNSPYGIVMGHNGNLTNELQALKPSKTVKPEEIFATVGAVHKRCKGAYAVIGLLVGRGVFAFRDPRGIRPAVIGIRHTDSGTEYAHDIDVVIPIPDTSRTSAMEVAFKLGVKFREGFIKNRYIGRTFIMPGQQLRKKSVRQKLSPIELEFNGKNVLLVDDSIVRGTTSGQIIEMARDAGAKKVYMASAAPPVRYPNVYGIDMPAASELIAHNKDVPEIEQAIGADWLIYQDLEDLVEAVRYDKHPIDLFESCCFDGEYITGDVDTDYLHSLQSVRSDDVKKTGIGGDDLVVL